eukprot:scaffold129514_cov54-Phaeocystis_antarctica.AAC.1
MAAPHVSGVAAQLLAEDPTLSVARVKQIILAATEVDSLVLSVNAEAAGTPNRLLIGGAGIVWLLDRPTSPPSPPQSPPSPPSPPLSPLPPLPPAPAASPPSPPPATARSVALGVGYCRDASGSNVWSTPRSCLDTVQECGQACEATAECACFAHTSPSANPNDAEGCKSAGSGRCVLYTGVAIATQSSGYVGYIAHRLDPAPPVPPSPSPPPSPPSHSPPSHSPSPLSPSLGCVNPETLWGCYSNCFALGGRWPNFDFQHPDVLACQ